MQIFKLMNIQTVKETMYVRAMVTSVNKIFILTVRVLIELLSSPLPSEIFPSCHCVRINYIY